MNPRILVSIVICVLVVLFGTIFFATRESAPLQQEETVATVLPPEITIRDVVKKTAHTISGTITVPTPCVDISTEHSVATEETPQVIYIKITTTESEGICLQKPETKTFSVKTTAASDAVIRTFVNGVEVPHS